MNKEAKRILLQISLFVITFITATLAGSEWATGSPLWFRTEYTWSDFFSGLQFSVPLLLILTAHEFGHYFMAMYHKVKTSLPYYIPLPPIPFLPLSIGTFGAVIHQRSRPESNLKQFDIGLAGPLAGLVVTILVLIYALKTLPPADHVFNFHPEYKQYGLNYADYVYSPEYLEAHKPTVDVTIGSNLIFLIFKQLADDPQRVPNPHEVMHYPTLVAVFIALFVTCLNLFPIGQLDGGHVVYGLFGHKIHKIIATVFFIALLFYAGLGLTYIKLDFKETIFGLPALVMTIPAYLLFLYGSMKALGLQNRDRWMYALLMFAVHFAMVNFLPGVRGYEGWLLFGLILGRLIGIQHPGAEIEKPLDPKRVILGWITLLVFILCFSPAPIRMTVIQ